MLLFHIGAGIGTCENKPYQKLGLESLYFRRRTENCFAFQKY